MNENPMNEWETQLRSWSPRRPSDSLAARLFGRPTLSEVREPEKPGGVPWLVPGMALALTMLMFVGQRASVEISPIKTTGSLAATILSNQSAAAAFSSTSIQMHNTLAGDTFEWTNGSASISSMNFIFPRKGSNH